MDFGEKIRTLRKDKMITQTELARQLHVSRRTVNGWENEGRRPKDHKIYYALSSILDCPAEYLISDKPGLVADVYETFGIHRNSISRRILLDIQAYFLSDSISAEEKDTLMFAVHEAYIEARKAGSDSWKKRKARYPDL